VKLAGHGVAVDLPQGWDGRIVRNRQALAEATTHAIVHAGNFPLPEGRGDFGTGAVELMRDENALVVLFEYHPDAATTPMFRNTGMPRNLSPDWFTRNQLQRTLPGQAGFQTFFNQRGRAFCLYVVLGSYANRARTVTLVNQVLQGVQIT
jgi:hypothetical protein